MQKYTRNQEKKHEYAILNNWYLEMLEEADWDYYEDEFVYDADCSCNRCIVIRMELLKQRLYEKHKNKPAVQTLKDFISCLS